MKNILIFEGIASSGKSTLEKLLAKRLPNSIIFSEGDTLMPMIENRDVDLAKEHLQSLLKTIRESPAQNVIVDRFHFTHAFRTQTELKEFADIESELQKLGNVAVIFLTIRPDQIKARIEETAQFREGAWKKGKQGSIDEKAEYYKTQQEILKTFVASSHLPTIVLDTTDKDWEAYAETTIRRLGERVRDPEESVSKMR